MSNSQEAIDTLTTLVNMEPQLRSEKLSQVISQLASGYASQDYVRQLSVHPNDIEFVKQWLDTVDMPPLVRQLVAVVPNDGSRAEPGVIVQSQIETEWLVNHYENAGLMEYLKQSGAPLMLTHRELKMLFLLQGVMDAEGKRKKILIPT